MSVMPDSKVRPARNPWLDIPESDYVGHMDSPAVGQRAVLGRLFGDAVRDATPEAVLIIGASTGNGLELIDPMVTRRVTCVDINESYLATLRQRAAHVAFEIDARSSDIMDSHFEPETFGLIHAALVLEYLEWRGLIPRVVTWLRPGGTLSVVLQRPSASTPVVTPTPFTSLLALASIFRFVEPDSFISDAHRAGLELTHRHDAPLPGNKAFTVLQMRKRP